MTAWKRNRVRRRLLKSDFTTINHEPSLHRYSRISPESEPDEYVKRANYQVDRCADEGWAHFHDQNKCKDAYVNITCTADAIIPSWSFMLVTSALTGIAKKIVFGDRDKLETIIWNDVFENLDVTTYRDARVVVKGCSDIPVPEAAYVALSEKLIPVVKSLMFGEPCSTVPVYKKK